MTGKWIIRLTLTATVLTAFFWCLWPLFAPIPASGASRTWHGYGIPALPRSTDFVGVLIFGLLFWSISRARLRSYYEAFALLFTLVWLSVGVKEGVLFVSIIATALFVALSLVARALMWFYDFVRDLCRDTLAAFGRTPANTM